LVEPAGSDRSQTADGKAGELLAQPRFEGFLIGSAGTRSEPGQPGEPEARLFYGAEARQVEQHRYRCRGVAPGFSDQPPGHHEEGGRLARARAAEKEEAPFETLERWFERVEDLLPRPGVPVDVVPGHRGGRSLAQSQIEEPCAMDRRLQSVLDIGMQVAEIPLPDLIGCSSAPPAQAPSR